MKRRKTDIGDILSKLNVLVVASHPDDEILGMGGTLLRHSAEGANISVMFMSDGVTGRDFIYEPKARASEIQNRKDMALKAGEIFGADQISFEDLPNLRMDQEYILELTKRIERRIDNFNPDIVYTHFSNDTNIDHCVTHRACVMALRPTPERRVSALRLFEIGSSTEYAAPMSGDSFMPNLFVDISAFSDKKFTLLKCYEDEMREFPHPRSEKAIKSRDIYRGASVGVGCAEAFMEIRRIIF